MFHKAFTFVPSIASKSFTLLRAVPLTPKNFYFLTFFDNFLMASVLTDQNARSEKGGVKIFVERT